MMIIISIYINIKVLAIAASIIDEELVARLDGFRDLIEWPAVAFHHQNILLLVVSRTVDEAHPVRRL